MRSTLIVAVPMAVVLVTACAGNGGMGGGGGGGQTMGRGQPSSPGTSVAVPATGSDTGAFQKSPPGP